MCGCDKAKGANGGAVARNTARLQPAVEPPGEQKEGYVLVKAILTRGRPDSVVPGVPRYPRMLYGQHWWVHPDDLAAQPLYFEALPEEPVAPPVPEPELAAPESGDAPAGFTTVSGIAKEAFDAALSERDQKRKSKPSRKEELRGLLDQHE